MWGHKTTYTRGNGLIYNTEVEVKMIFDQENISVYYCINFLRNGSEIDKSM